MGQTIFTTKKMKLESKSWVRKTIVGTVITAILGAGAFGAYMLVNQSESESEASSRSRHQASNYDSSGARKSMLPAYAQQNDAFSSLGDSKRHISSHSKTKNAISNKSKSSKGKHFASAHNKKHKRHLGKKYAKMSKHNKHKVAAHKKHGKKHLAHSKHGKKKIAHKKHRSGNTMAQR